MYLSEVYAENFRCFGEGTSSSPLQLTLGRGLNALVGENDAGKSAIIDAIRFCLLTNAVDYSRLTDDDFHCSSHGRSESLRVRCSFRGLSGNEAALFLEHLGDENDERVLHVHLRARRLTDGSPRRVATELRSGRDGEQSALDGEAREYLRVTFLRALRDAESDLRPGRNSRLAAILAGHQNVREEDDNDFDPATDSASRLVGIMARAEYHIRRNSAIVAAETEINTEYLEAMAIANDDLRSEISVAMDGTLIKVLEKLELRLAADPSQAEWTKRGLGYSNAMFMAAELLLTGGSSSAGTLLVEEPEAHLHPQLQARIVSLLRNRSDRAESPVQVILTTHSPSIASSLPLDGITIVAKGQCFSLSRQETLLDDSDYAFLERFLDATKSNLFFARSVAIVEGDAEAIILPALAQAMGISLERAGVSIVNVGHVGLFRYSRIFQRRDGRSLPVRVACIRDLDLVPDSVPDDMRRSLQRYSDLSSAEVETKRKKLADLDGGPVTTFVSDFWTLEYDLARASRKLAVVMLGASRLASAANNAWPHVDLVSATMSAAQAEVDDRMANGDSLDLIAVDCYRPLRSGNASKSIAAQFAAAALMSTTIDASEIPPYLRSSFEYMTGE